MTESPSRVCRSDHQDSEAPINHQTHLELYASYVYLAVSCCFDPDGVACHEEREYAEKLMKLQNQQVG
ncbi:hypothetical protein E2I00_001693 [Balaenoptera physalus]|uniref:Ferritin heavy chain n=1 Tax=Balaenoptera physalus TaxID=9770 RepID=A0A643C9Y1_BALPH|nr:hypothetical protein E2I00_001693 [Balaenoptera physalus]